MIAEQADASVEPSPLPSCGFYTVADARFFVGAVALLNSLRLVGHDEPFFLVDCGLEEWQRELLAGQATVVAAPPGEPAVYLTPFGPLTHPAEVAVVLDADVIVTRQLTELIGAARSGRIVAFEDPPPVRDRSFAEWQTTLDLPRLRRQPYVQAGQLFLPAEGGPRLLRLWRDAQRRVPLAATRYGKAHLDDPFYFADMDILNAIVASHFGPEELLSLEPRYASHPPFAGLVVADPVRLDCRYADGERPFVLHHTLGKPWLQATRATPYSTLLTRLLLAPDVAVRLEPRMLPLRLREGRLAAADRRRAHLQAVVRANARRQLGRFGVRTRIRRWRAERRRRRS